MRGHRVVHQTALVVHHERALVRVQETRIVVLSSHIVQVLRLVQHGRVAGLRLVVREVYGGVVGVVVALEVAAFDIV